ncbi:hypothetical protein MMC21_002140 [Puttea exsequens]|nr:hypothetical protein [Puttea exsequens]
MQSTALKILLIFLFSLHVTAQSTTAQTATTGTATTGTATTQTALTKTATKVTAHEPIRPSITAESKVHGAFIPDDPWCNITDGFPGPRFYTAELSTKCYRLPATLTAEHTFGSLEIDEILNAAIVVYTGGNCCPGDELFFTDSSEVLKSQIGKCLTMNNMLPVKSARSYRLVEVDTDFGALQCV